MRRRVRVSPYHSLRVDAVEIGENVCAESAACSMPGDVMYSVTRFVKCPRRPKPRITGFGKRRRCFALWS